MGRYRQHFARTDRAVGQQLRACFDMEWEVACKTSRSTAGDPADVTAAPSIRISAMFSDTVSGYRLGINSLNNEYYTTNFLARLFAPRDKFVYLQTITYSPKQTCFILLQAFHTT